MISAGRMRFTATIHRDNEQDIHGKKKLRAPTGNPATEGLYLIGSFRCDLRDLGAGEFDYGGGSSSVNTWEVQTRWQAITQYSLREDDKLLVDGKLLNIVGIRNEANRDRLATITAEEIR
jgi:hypothetical protein